MTSLSALYVFSVADLMARYSYVEKLGQSAVEMGAFRSIGIDLQLPITRSLSGFSSGCGGSEVTG